MQRPCQGVLVGHGVVAPLAYDGAVVQEQEGGVAACDGLQRQLVHEGEGVFRSGEVLPAVDGAVAGGCQAEEAVAILLGVVAEGVDVLDIAVVGLLQIRRDQEEGVGGVGEDGVGVDAGILGICLDIEVQDFGCLCGVFGPLHCRGNMLADVEGSEVDDGFPIDADARQEQRSKDGAEGDDPLHGFGNKARQLFPLPPEDGQQHEQEHVLAEGLPVGEVEGVAKAAAVRDGIGDGQPQCEGRVDEEHGDHQREGRAATDAEEQAYAEAELQHGLEHGERDGEEGTLEEPRQVHGYQIVMNLIGCAIGVHQLDEAGEDKRGRYCQTADKNEGIL